MLSLNTMTSTLSSSGSVSAVGIRDGTPVGIGYNDDVGAFAVGANIFRRCIVVPAVAIWGGTATYCNVDSSVVGTFRTDAAAVVIGSKNNGECCWRANGKVSLENTAVSITYVVVVGARGQSRDALGSISCSPAVSVRQPLPVALMVAVPLLSPKQRTSVVASVL